MTRISAIAAISEKKRAIGKDKKLLWDLPDDLKRFREITRNHPVIMGRGTYDHILLTTGKALKNRTNIVVSHNRDKVTAPDFICVDTFEEAIELAKRSPGGDSEIFVMGGGKLWSSELSHIQRLYLTIVKDEPEADAFFPEYTEFKKVVEKSEIMQNNGVSFYYLTVER